MRPQQPQQGSQNVDAARDHPASSRGMGRSYVFRTRTAERAIPVRGAPWEWAANSPARRSTSSVPGRACFLPACLREACGGCGRRPALNRCLPKHSRPDRAFLHRHGRPVARFRFMGPVCSSRAQPSPLSTQIGGRPSAASSRAALFTASGSTSQPVRSYRLRARAQRTTTACMDECFLARRVKAGSPGGSRMRCRSPAHDMQRARLAVEGPGTSRTQFPGPRATPQPSQPPPRPRISKTTGSSEGSMPALDVGARRMLFDAHDDGGERPAVGDFAAGERERRRPPAPSVIARRMWVQDPAGPGRA